MQVVGHCSKTNCDDLQRGICIFTTHVLQSQAQTQQLVLETHPLLRSDTLNVKNQRSPTRDRLLVPLLVVDQEVCTTI